MLPFVFMPPILKKSEHIVCVSIHGSMYQKKEIRVLKFLAKKIADQYFLSVFSTIGIMPL